MSHSRFLMKRKNTSSTGSTKPVSTMPSARTAPTRQVAHVVVVGGGQRQMQPRRAAAFNDLRRAISAALPQPARFVDGHDATPHGPAVLCGRWSHRIPDCPACKPRRDAFYFAPNAPLAGRAERGTGIEANRCCKSRDLPRGRSCLARVRGRNGKPQIHAEHGRLAGGGRHAAPAPQRRRRLSNASMRLAPSASPASTRVPCRCCCRSTSTPSARTWPTARPRPRPRINISAIFIRPNFSCPAPPATTSTSSSTQAKPDSSHRFDKPIVVEITGAAYVYDLDGPNHEEVFPAAQRARQASSPGMRRILREAHVRYAFERFGVPYVVSIQCYDQRAVDQISVVQGSRSDRRALPCGS